jgi:3'-5' exoribonuclease
MKFESVKIADLKAGESINGIYILKSKEYRVATNKKAYLDLVFMDQTGEVNAKNWEPPTEADFSLIELNKLYYVNARVDFWKDALQLTVNKMKPADEEDQNKIGDFVPSAPFPAEEMLSLVYSFASRIANYEIKNVVLSLLDQREKKLMYYPAAKSLHHAIRCGLLYHMKRMLESAEALALVYDSINTDLLFAGVILHDLAKMDEMDANNLGIAEYSKVGKLLGHIVIGVSEIDRVSRELEISDEVSLLLKHMVLSHHEIPEYGSPKPPMFLEAELLHFIDTIDARVYDYENALKDVQPGSFSAPVWSLDKRNLYKPNI